MSQRPDSPVRPALTINRIAIRQFDGITRPFELGGLGPGINVIHGPNAIGKSRTAAAMLGLIWPELMGANSDINGTYTIENDDWHIENRYAQVHFQRNAQRSDRPTPGIVPSNQHDRYVLTLHDLLRVDDRQFAQTIRRESAGGYDLAAARDALGLGLAAPRSGQSRPRRAWDEARRAVGDLRHEDAALQTRERDRDNILRRLDATDQATIQLVELQAVREYAVAVQDRAVAEIARAAFEDPIGSLAGDESERVCQHEALMAQLERERTALERERDRHRQVLDSTGFGDSLPADADLVRMNQLLADLRHVDTSLQQTTDAIGAQQARVDELRRRIGARVSESQVERLDTLGLRTLEQALSKLREISNEEAAADVLEEWLGSTSAVPDIDRLRRGLDIVALQLRTTDTVDGSTRESLMRWSLVVAGGIIVALAAVMAVIDAQIWVVLALLAVPFFWIALRHPKSNSEAVLDQARRELSALGFEAGGPSSTSRLLETYDQIRTELAEATLESQKALRLQGLAPRRASLARLREETSLTIAGQQEHLGVNLSNHAPEDVRLLAEALDRWRQGTEALVSDLARERQQRARRDEILTFLTSAVTALGELPATDAHDASARVDSVGQRITTARQALSGVGEANARLEQQVLPALDAEREAIRAIYNRIGFGEPDLFRLQELCGRVEPCLRAQKALETARVVEQTRRLPIQETRFVDNLPSPAELDALIARSREEASHRDGILSELARLDADVARARRQTTLEDALERQREALEALRSARDHDVAAMAAWQVVEFVQRQTRDLSRPAVFHQARSLFSQFTAGAWRLELAEGSNAAFQAVETSTGRVHELERLSSGTRVQLLMAVRIAFIEATEQGLQLPLLMDETLGNADDLRANAIIDATLKLAAGGRQVLYFTAQQDEIAKWQSRTDESGSTVGLTLIDLEAARSQNTPRQVPQITWRRSLPPAPEFPEDATHADLRTLLRVAPIDFWADHLDGVDLWYLIHDVGLLRTLRTLRITTWGQYREFRQHESLSLPGVPDDLDSVCEARAQVIELLRRGFQRGRPRPLTRDTLLALATVSDRFRDELANLAEALDWDAASLVRALRDRRIPGFRQQTIRDIEEACRERGHICDDTPLDEHMLRAVVMSGVQPLVDRGTLHQAEVVAFLDLLGSSEVSTVDARTPSV